MAFLLYDQHAKSNGSKVYTRIREVSLGGKSGPIASFALARKNRKVPGWHLPEDMLLAHFEASPKTHALFIDLKPNVKGNVSLYRIEDIWGYSADGWTPILLRLEHLFSDLEVENPSAFKQEFSDWSAQKCTTYEFLYLQGETEEDSWNWGRVGSVNGTLLFPDALEYFWAALEINRKGQG